MYEALGGTHQLPKTEIKQLLKRAIDIRVGDCGATSSRLGSLYEKIAVCCVLGHDNVGAETYYLNAIASKRTPMETVYAWTEIAQFYGNAGLFNKQESAWRKAIDISIKNKLPFDARSWINLMNDLRRKGFNSQADEILTNMLLRQVSNCADLDKYLAERVEGDIKAGDFQKAADLIKKRIAMPPPEGTAGIELSEWQIRLSNIYLAEGNSKESDDIFNRVIASYALQGFSTDELRADRAALLNRLGRQTAAAPTSQTVAKLTGDVVLASPVMAKELIRFGHNTLIASFDSTQKSADGRPSFPIYGAPSDPLMVICEGAVAHESHNILFGGLIACQHSDFQGSSGVHLASVPTGVVINDAIQCPASALAPQQVLRTTGDFIVGGGRFPQMVSFQNDASKATRFFIQNVSHETAIDLGFNPVPNVSFQQVQVWYNGTTPIKLQDFSGLLYAPHAKVTIEFNGHFRGALVARQIYLEGNNHLEFDRGVIGKNFGR